MISISEWRICVAPPKKDTEAIMLRLPRPMVLAIDEARGDKPDAPGRPEFLRRLIQKWIDDGCPKI
jgi:hypothetical protein